MKTNLISLTVILITLSLVTYISNYAIILSHTQYLDVLFFLTITAFPVLILGTVSAVVIKTK